MNQLKRVSLLEQSADNFGFSWENTGQIMAQIQSECLEVEAHLTADNMNFNPDLLQEEIGDLLHAAFSLCVFCQFDLEKTLEKTLNKFERRLTDVKLLAHDAGFKTLKAQSFEVLMDLWRQAKVRVG